MPTEKQPLCKGTSWSAHMRGGHLQTIGAKHCAGEPDPREAAQTLRGRRPACAPMQCYKFRRPTDAATEAPSPLADSPPPHATAAWEPLPCMRGGASRRLHEHAPADEHRYLPGPLPSRRPSPPAQRDPAAPGTLQKYVRRHCRGPSLRTSQQHRTARQPPAEDSRQAPQSQGPCRNAPLPPAPPLSR